MSQKITVTKVGDHYEMQFDAGDAYPVPENAIETLDDDLAPEEVGASVTFRGDYGGHKHAKTFDVEEVVETPGSDDGAEEEGATEQRPVDLDQLEKGDEVRHVDDPDGQTRAVTGEPEKNPLAGEVVQVEVQQGTISRDSEDNWRVVE